MQSIRASSLAAAGPDATLDRLRGSAVPGVGVPPLTTVTHRRTTTVALISGPLLLREALQSTLEVDPYLDFVASAESIKSSHDCGGRPPDVVVICSPMPPGEYDRRPTEILRHWPAARLILMTSEQYAPAILGAFGNGAHGCVCDESSGAELREGVRTVGQGRRYLCQRASRIVVGSILHVQADIPPIEGAITPREREIIAMIAMGLGSKDIARELVRSVRTIDKHRGNLMAKLGLRNVADITSFAVRRGLI